MSVYFVANIEITNHDEYLKYLTRCDEVFLKYNGKYLAINEDPIIVEGKYSYTKSVIIEFPNQINFDEWYHSIEYQEILLYRLKGSKSDSILLNGNDYKFKFFRTNIKDQKVNNLIKLLDIELCKMYNEKQKEYTKLNVLNENTNTILVEYEGLPVGIGCIKQHSKTQFEIKRVYIKEEMRGKGISKNIIKELEIWAKELNAKELILETGIKQETAINLYKSLNYQITNNYGEYILII